MAVVVQKYGGSSVADVEKLGKVADKVVAARRAGDQVVVVVSAMGKTTDQLLALAKQVDETPPRRELDMLLTTGERVSMALLSMAIQKRGEAAISFTGSQSGIITNDRHFDARIIEVRPHRIEDELSRGRIVIVAGYQGMSYRREITTLGRGGSDTTAIALAAALGAERAEIYSDVDGVYTADPRVVPEAAHLPELGYEQMQEMADVGAKVLNATAVELAKKAKIWIHARASFAPGKETVVREGAGQGAVSVVGQRGVVRARVGSEADLKRALNVLADVALPPRDVELGASGASFLVPTALTPDWRAIEARLGAEVASLQIEPGLGAASVVGDLPERALAQALDRVERTRGASATGGRVSLLVAEDELDAAVRTLHAHFVA
ncbi:MAG: aspartate kinase [Sandaracinus sp.]